jgi:penicillin-binding protein 1A
VIWEAFKAETEPKRSIRQEELATRDDTPKKTAETQSDGAAGPANAPSASVGTKRDQEFIQQEGGIY